jgi:hypothetical protein
MKRRWLPAITVFAAAAMFSLTATAEGAGRYTVTGTNNKDKANYQGTATISKIGNSTWHIVEIIADDTLEGFGIGDGKVIAATYSTEPAPPLRFTLPTRMAPIPVYGPAKTTRISTPKR